MPEFTTFQHITNFYKMAMALAPTPHFPNVFAESMFINQF